MIDIKALFSKFKFPVMIICIAIFILLLPDTAEGESKLNDTDLLLSEILSCTNGVGDAKVIVSDNGVVVVCAGAHSADVRLEIIKAVSSYTGFSSDRITVLKMAQPK